MKRHNKLWNRVTNIPHLCRAAQKASRGKRGNDTVAKFLFNLENEICRLQDELCSKTYQPGAYRTFEIFDPKRRLISAAPFRDRVVHHALCGVLEQVFEPTFIYDSYACRRFKGNHAAVDRFTEFSRRYKYVLKCDVRQFFPSIDHAILKELIIHKIKDRDVLWLVECIIDASNPQELAMHWFPGDDLFTPSERRRGLPIGNQTSQFFANVYLNPFDHYVKEELGVRGYIRYVDDFVLFGNDKRQLAVLRERCQRYLQKLRLRLPPQKAILSRVSQGTRFLGYRVFPTHRLLPRESTIRIRRRLRQMQQEFSAGSTDAETIRHRLQSWIGHAGHANTYRLRSRLICGTKFCRGS